MRKAALFLHLMLVVILSAGMMGCAEPEPEEMPALGSGGPQVALPPPLAVVFDYSGKTIQLYEGQALIVTLESNQTTGFSWELVEITQDVLEKVSDEYVVPEQKEGPPIVGAGGKEIWTFQAIKEGTGQISMEYNQPWEGGEKKASTFDLTVEVQKLVIGPPE